MGKSQKKRAVRRHNPVRVPDSHLSHGLETASSTSSRTETILPIMQKLGSADPAERTWACAAVSTMIQNDPSTRRLLQGKNVVGALITRLTDATEEVMIEAAGALRNLCIDGGYDICAEMYNKNIMAPLRTFPAKISVTLQRLLDSPKGHIDDTCRLVYAFAESIITIFWCLSETSNKALQAINDIKLTPFLMSFLQSRRRLQSSTVNAAAQCLYVLSEDNGPIIDDLRTESSFVACLLEIIQDEAIRTETSETRTEDVRSVTLQILASGILRNMYPLPAVIPASSINLDDKIILPLLLPQLSMDLFALSATVTRIIASGEVVDTNLSVRVSNHNPQSDHKSSFENELEYIEAKLHLTQLSLEILTGVCAKVPESQPGFEDIRDSALGSDNDIDMQPANERMEQLIETESNPPDLEALPEINTLLSTLTIPLVNLVYPTPLSFPPSPSEPSIHPPTTSGLSTIHIRALECLNNIFLAIGIAQDSAPNLTRLSSKDVEQLKHLWNELWRAMGQVGEAIVCNNTMASRGSEKRMEMWEICVGVMWGIARFGRGHLVPDPEQVQTLVGFCEASTDDVIKTKIIGTLECLAQFRDAVELNKTISSYLLQYISSHCPTCVESCIQCASALIDIYSDECSPYDVNFRRGNMMDGLARVLPMMREMVRSIDRRKPGGRELRWRGDEVLENLFAFIEYRKNLKL